MQRSIFVLLVLITGTFSQVQWVKQCCSSNEYLRSIYFVNENTGWVAGDSGKIYKTTDKGTVWELVYSDSIFSIMHSVFFIDDINGWTSGKYNYSCGFINKTTDGGKNWKTIYSDCDKYLFYSLHFFDIDTGYVLSANNSNGWSILKTENGGYNWTEIYRGHFLSSLFFLNRDTAWVSGGSFPGRVLKTTNGGANWSTYMADQSDQLHSVWFINKNTGWSTGYGIRYVGVILKSTDGGLTWTKQDSIFNNTPHSVQFIDENTGYVSGVGFVKKTTTGGRKWATQYFDLIFWSQFFHNSDIGWLAGGSIMMTTTGGGEFSFSLPAFFSLTQNYPNPFNSKTVIKFQISDNPSVIFNRCTLVIYDVAGRKIYTLFDQYAPPGEYSVSWDASNYPSGLYFYRISAGSFTETKKMVLLK